jgi:hypothetical protein
MRPLVIVLFVAACGHPGGGGGDDNSGDDDRGDDDDDAPAIDARGGGDGDGAPQPDANSSGGGDASSADAASPDAASPDAAPGVIDGGPCMSGAPGATAYRIRWANGGGTAYVVYEVHGLPDGSRDHAGAYGQIGFTPQFVDPFLGEGGLLLDGSDFVDLELSTVGVANIASAHLAIYGRSYHTTTSGSFDWQTFDGVGAAPTNAVSNVAPYAWYAADMTTEISPGDDGVLIRIRSGPSSDTLVVHRIELCVDAS